METALIDSIARVLAWSSVGLMILATCLGFVFIAFLIVKAIFWLWFNIDTMLSYVLRKRSSGFPLKDE